MDAPTDIPLKIQLGWRSDASTAEERNPYGSRKGVWIIATLQYANWRLARCYWKETFPITGVTKPSSWKHLCPGQILTLYNTARRCPISFFFSVFSLGLWLLARSQCGKQCEDHTSMSGSGFHTPICGCCGDKQCIWIVSECGTDLFRQHPRRKFNLFVSNTVDSLTRQIIPSIFPLFMLMFNMFCSIWKKNILHERLKCILQKQALN